MILDVILQRCAIAIHALGPMPPWYRPLKRRAWKRTAAAIRAFATAQAMQVAFEQAFADVQRSRGLWSVPARADEGEVN